MNKQLLMQNIQTDTIIKITIALTPQPFHQTTPDYFIKPFLHSRNYIKQYLQSIDNYVRNKTKSQKFITGIMSEYYDYNENQVQYDIYLNNFEIKLSDIKLFSILATDHLNTVSYMSIINKKKISYSLLNHNELKQSIQIKSTIYYFKIKSGSYFQTL